MEWSQTLLSWGIPIITVGALTWLFVALVQRLVPNEAGSRVKRQLLAMGVVVFMLIILALVLPLAQETRGQLLSLFGLVLTAVVGLASTTFVSNAMAGFMLRSVSSFHAGDFIRVGDHFGRVTETALLHTEIQSEDRDLVTLPNLYLITQPVRVVRTSGTLISTDVSLGYDVNRKRVRSLLTEAAEDAKLTDPFVQITELGDFSVNYRISGFLEDVASLVSKRTQLRASVLDRLHQDGVEIVSPNFMNQRPLDPKQPIIPRRNLAAEDDDATGHAETLMFDKAEVAARMKKFRQQRDVLLAEIKNLKDDPDTNEFEVTWRERQVESINEILTNLSTEPLEIS